MATITKLREKQERLSNSVNTYKKKIEKIVVEVKQLEKKESKLGSVSKIIGK